MTCTHNNKYTTGFGKITYDYCPDCKEEVSNVVEFEDHSFHVKAHSEYRGLLHTLSNTSLSWEDYADTEIQSLVDSCNFNSKPGGINTIWATYDRNEDESVTMPREKWRYLTDLEVIVDEIIGDSCDYSKDYITRFKQLKDKYNQ